MFTLVNILVIIINPIMLYIFGGEEKKIMKNIIKTKKAIGVIVALILSVTLVSAGVVTFYAQSKAKTTVIGVLKLDGTPCSGAIIDETHTDMQGNTTKYTHTLWSAKAITIAFIINCTPEVNVTVEYLGEPIELLDMVAHHTYTINTTYVVDPYATLDEYLSTITIKQWSFGY